MSKMRWNTLLHWFMRISANLRRAIFRTAQEEPMPQNLRRGQVI